MTSTSHGSSSKSIEEALQFFEGNDKDNEVDIEDGNVVEFKGSDGSVQSTLI